VALAEGGASVPVGATAHSGYSWSRGSERDGSPVGSFARIVKVTDIRHRHWRFPSHPAKYPSHVFLLDYDASRGRDWTVNPRLPSMR
jgi:hypothetical protein